METTSGCRDMTVITNVQRTVVAVSSRRGFNSLGEQREDLGVTELVLALPFCRSEYVAYRKEPGIWN